MTTQTLPQTQTQPQKRKLPIQTQHCRFCNHLLLATTRTLSALPRRGEGAQDKAIIIPLEDGDTEAEAEAEAEADAEEEEAEEAESASHKENQPGTATSSSNPKSKAKTKARTKHTTLLLSTTLPDRRPTLIRREDGIEKRILLRCGRCRVVVGYYLDKVHWDTRKGKGGGGEEGGSEERPPAVYVLPGAVVETEEMGGEGGVGEREWRGWDV